MTERLRGVVKFFDANKGWGFIAVDGRDDDVFVHRDDLGRTVIVDGDKVTFELVAGKKGKGPKAANVQLGA